MHRFIFHLTALSCVLAVVASDLSADSYRCGRKLITTGDSTSDLLRVCGEPRYKDRGNETIRINGISKDTRVERWYYKKSARSLEHAILVYKGAVVGVEVGSR
jgi:hypothetical protein